MKAYKKESVNAWVFQANKVNVSLGNFELKMLIEDAQIIDINNASVFYPELLLLDKKLIPIVNIPYLLGKKPSKNTAIGLVVYTDSIKNEIAYGAIKFDQIPIKVPVTDDMEISSKNNKHPLLKYSRTIFEYKNNQIIVLDLNKLFNIRENNNEK